MTGAFSVIPAKFIDDARVSVPARIVMQALSALLNRRGEASIAAHDDIAHQTGFSRRTVIRHMNDLCELGWVTKTARHDPVTRAQLANVYHINFANPVPEEHDRSLEYGVRPAAAGQDRQDQAYMHGLGGGDRRDTPPVTPQTPEGDSPDTPGVSGGSQLYKDKNLLEESLNPMAMAIGHGTGRTEARDAFATTGLTSPEAKAEGQGQGNYHGFGQDSGFNLPTGTSSPDEGAIEACLPEGQALAADFAAIRREYFPTAPRMPPPQAARTCAEYLAQGMSAALVREVFTEQFRAISARRSPFPASPSMFRSDMAIALDQDRRRRCGRDAGSPAHVPANPWHQADGRLRRQLQGLHKDSQGLIDIRKRAERLGLGPDQLEAMFTEAVWRQPDPVYEVKMQLMDLDKHRDSSSGGNASRP